MTSTCSSPFAAAPAEGSATAASRATTAHSGALATGGVCAFQRPEGTSGDPGQRARIVTVIFVVEASVALATTTQLSGWASGSVTDLVIGVIPVALPIPFFLREPLRHS